MSLLTRLTLFAILLPLTSWAAAPGGGDGTADSDPFGGGHENAVSAKLIADVAAARPGSQFQVAVEIRMDKGWHTYWENGGDAGLPTMITWELPEGFSASEIQWPVPHRYEEDGDIVTFGYADVVRLLVDIDVDPSVALGEVELRAAVDWLQCKDICVPGSDEVDLRLPIESASRAVPSAILARFESARAELPTSVTQLRDVGVQAFQREDALAIEAESEIGVVFSGIEGAQVASAEFFPRPSETLWTRDGTFRQIGDDLGLVIPVEVDSGAEPGSVVMYGGVVRIPTDGGEALLLSFELPVTIAQTGQVGQTTNAVLFGGSGLAIERSSTEASGSPATPSLLKILLFAFLGGIILNVMPCVLPVISLKILGFVSKANEDPKKIASLGWTFASGVVASFLVLGLAVIAFKAAGQHIGWGFQFQNPGFVAALAMVVFVFSLSLLGVFEIGATVASSVSGGVGVSRKDHADAFFHGVLTTVLATPCTAPMLGTAIAFAFAQPAWVILLVFFTVSAGLAFPYVLLSLQPAWLKFVPRPGPWMDTFKQGMGFLLLATLVWLLSVFGAQTGTTGLVWMLAFLLVLGVLSWVHGRFLTLSAGRGRKIAVWSITAIVAVAGYVELLEKRAFAQEFASTGPKEATNEVTKHGTVWEPFSVAYLEESVDAGRTVFIDFTAEWCLTCKVNEKTVLADQEVAEKFRDHGVLTLKGDWTRKDPEITAILERHQRSGVPFYAVYPAGRPDQVIVLPEIINKRLVLESLDKAGPSRSGA